MFKKKGGKGKHFYNENRFLLDYWIKEKNIPLESKVAVSIYYVYFHKFFTVLPYTTISYKWELRYNSYFCP